MKLLLIAPQPFFTIRGTPIAVRELISAITKLGHSVDLLTFHLGEDIQIPNLTIYRNKLFSKLIKSIPPGFSVKKFILDLVILPKALFMIIKHKYDVVHCVEESAFFIALFRWIGPFKFVYDMDSDIPKQLTESNKIKNKLLLNCIKKIEKHAINKSDCVITICPVFTDKIKKLNPNKKVFQLEDVSIKDDIKPQQNNNEKKTILYTGNFQKYQGVELLINGFIKISGKHPKAELLLVGGEPSEIETLKNKYPSNKITYAGKRPLAEMPDYLEKADILVSPRAIGENTPFKIYSYLASNKPILATDIISHSQILTNEENALLVEPKEEKIAQGLEKILNNEPFSEKIANNAKILFQENYTKQCYENKVKNYLNYMEDKNE